MTTLVHQVVGEEKIFKICEARGLTSEDRKIVDRILEEWEKLIGHLPKKMEVAIELAGQSPRHRQIVSAILDITAEFATLRILGKADVPKH